MDLNDFIDNLTKKEIIKLLNVIPSWNIEDQIFPLYINSGLNRTSLINLRKSLLKERLPGEIKLMNYCKLVYEDFIEQYPFIITNRDYWINLVKEMKLPSEYIGRNAFFVDGFSPSRNLAIEADYESTHNNMYDMARDTYLRNICNIDLRRVRGYGQNTREDEKIKKFLEKFRTRYNQTEPIDYTKYAIKNYLLLNYPQLYDSLEKISMGKRPGPTYYKFCKWLGRNP